MSEEIYLDAPCLGNREKEMLNRAIDEGYVSTVGPFVSEFEEKFASYLGVPGAVSLQSGTAALHIALYELGIGNGDEVIVPALTFVATVNPVLYCGATPVFVDVDPFTWTIDTQKIEEHITSNTKAIIPVYLYGIPCAMDKIMDIASRYNLFVIEDATESLGARYKGEYTGTFGDLGCFSFNGNKLITTGGGGMVIGKDGEKLKHIKFLINQARYGSEGYFHPEIGFNYRMTNIEAALGIAQLEQIEDFLDKKKAFHSIYKEELKEAESITFQEEYLGSEGSYWLTAALVNEKKDLGTIQSALKERGVPTRRVFTPIPEFPFCAPFKQEKYENAYRIYKQGLCLPSSTRNSRDDIHYVCQVIKEVV